MRLTTSRDGRWFEGDPAGTNPSVGAHEHQRVRSSARSALLAGGRRTGGVADDKTPLEALTGVLVFLRMAVERITLAALGSTRRPLSGTIARATSGY